MEPKTRNWLYGGIALVLAVLAIVGFVASSRTEQRPAAAAQMPTPPPPAPDEAAAPTADVGEDDPEEAEPGPATVDEKPVPEPPESEAPDEDELLDEERFIEVAAKIRLWQETLDDTPEGRRKLDELVRQLLNSERLTPQDLEAFGERVGPEAIDRLDAKIDQRVAEFGQRRYHVEAKPTEGTRIIAQDTPESAEGDQAP